MAGERQIFHEDSEKDREELNFLMEAYLQNGDTGTKETFLTLIKDVPWSGMQSLERDLDIRFRIPGTTSTEKMRILDLKAGILNIRWDTAPRNTGVNTLEQTEMPSYLPFRVIGGKNGSYDFSHQEVRPTWEHAWEITLFFQKTVSNGRFPLTRRMVLGVMSNPSAGIATVVSNGRQYSIVIPRHTDYASIRQGRGDVNISRESKKEILRIGRDDEILIEF